MSGLTAISLSATAGFGVSSIDRVRFDGLTGNGINTTTGLHFVSVSNSVFENIILSAVRAGSASGTYAFVETSVVANNAIGVNAAVTGNTVAIANNAFFGNTTPIAFVAGGTIMSAGNNRIVAATTVTNPNATMTMK